MARISSDDVIGDQCEALRSGAEREQLAVLSELAEISGECRARVDRMPCSVFKDPAVREKFVPWLEFRKIVGEPLFSVILELVSQAEPSPVRAAAGDIMARLWHPAAIGRLLEDFEGRREKSFENQPLRIFRDLGGIGTEAAAKALMWLWGTDWDADAAGALGMCDSDAAQDFLLKNAAAHSDPYVRSVCLAHLRAPVTAEKAEVVISRLTGGTQSEQFVAAMKVKEFRLVSALPALISARAGNSDGALAVVINEALLVLRRWR